MSRIRRVARTVVGRDRWVWRTLASPRLRWSAFHDPADLLVYALLLSLPRVRFIQIGSNDGRTNDPLWSFRNYPHWRGVLVEPDPAAYAHLVRNYRGRGDRFVPVNAAIGEVSGSIPFHHLARDDRAGGHWSQLGSLDRALVERHAEMAGAPGEPVVSTRVRSLSFDDLCRELQIGEFDLLHVDAEGSDAVVLAQVELRTRKPAVVVYEHVHLTPEERAACRRRLLEGGYRVVSAVMDTMAVEEVSLRRLRRLRTAWDLVSG